MLSTWLLVAEVEEVLLEAVVVELVDIAHQLQENPLVARLVRKQK
jgi:hypothetical protein